MTIIRAIAFLLHFTIVPVALGRLITYKQRNDRDSAIATYIIGLFGSFAMFYVLCSLLVWHQYWNTFTEPFTGSFSALCISYSALIAVLLLVWLKKDLQAIKGFKTTVKELWRDRLIQIRTNKFLNIYIIALLVLVFVQLYFAYAYEINEWSYDDYDYVVNSQDTISTDTISYVNFVNGEMPYLSDKRAITAWPTYIAYLAKVSGFEVTTVCHTILSVLLLFIAFAVYYYIAKFLFKDYENRFIFMIILMVLNMFGLYSHYSPTFRLLGAIWQGKAVLYAIALPFFLVYLFQIYSQNVESGRVLPLVALSMGACSLTTMSALLISATAIVVWLCSSIFNRKICAVRYLMASMMGVIYLFIYYVLISMLFRDMMDENAVYFKRGRDINWWYKWFG
jgi:hypothetical protein